MPDEEKELPLTLDKLSLTEEIARLENQGYFVMSEKVLFS